MDKTRKNISPCFMVIVATLAGSLVLPSVAQSQEVHRGMGSVASAFEATQNGIVLKGGGTIFDKDLIATGPTGRVQIVFWPSSQITLNENTSVLVNKVIDQVRLQLHRGNVVASGSHQNLVVIVTPRFEIEPPHEEVSKVYVGLMDDNTTYIESADGDTVIVEPASGRSYLLTAGKNALVPANSSGIPGMQPMKKSANTEPPASPAKSEVPPTPAAVPPERIAKQSHSHGTGILIGVLAAAGAAGGIAAASSGGNNVASSPPVLSPSRP